MRIGKALGTGYEPRLHMQNKRDAIRLMKSSRHITICDRIEQRVSEFSFA